LALAQTASPATPVAGQPLTYTVTVTNAGPQPAYGVTVMDLLPSTVAFVSASPGCVYSSGAVSCSLSPLLAGGAATLSVTVTPTVGGQITNTVTIASVTPNANSANNTITSLTAVAPASPPVITANPTNAVVLQGTDVGFRVGASGSPPLSYQWLFNGTSLASASASVLTLKNVQATQAGNYSVVVANTLASATSGLASLTVLVPPTLNLNSLSGMGGAVTFSVDSVVGLNYTLEFKTNLTDPDWTPLLPPVPGTGSPITLQDTNGPLNATGFYRVNCW
jgi:uncharacterized repeat protein (TIGR01451 family)